MSDIENKVQKCIIQVSKFLPEFVDKWKELLDDAKKPVRGLVNLSEQLRHVEKVHKTGEDDFFEIQQRVLFSIYQGIEEEMENVKNIITKLNKLNVDLKNKLSNLENTSMALNWDDTDSTVIKGSALQPSLRKLLDFSLDFLIYFITNGKNIHSSFKEINVRDEKVMKKLEESFDVDLNHTDVTNLLAITQYVENEKGLV